MQESDETGHRGPAQHVQGMVSLGELASRGVAFAQRSLRRKQPPIAVRIRAPGVGMYLNGLTGYSPMINRLFP